MSTVTPHLYRWVRPLGKRIGDPPVIALHHSVSGPGTTVEDIHEGHKKRGYSGIGYHEVFYPDGSIHAGRPHWAYGAHTLNANAGIGLCFIGDFTTKKMPAKQFEAGRKRIAELRKKYPDAKVLGHRQVPGNSTACPGLAFPLNDITRPQTVKPGTKILLTKNDISLRRQVRPRRAGWWNYGFIPYVEQLRKQGDGHRVKLGRREVVTIPVPKVRPDWWPKMMEYRRHAGSP